MAALRHALRLGCLMALVPGGISIAQMPPSLLAPPPPRTALPGTRATPPPAAPAPAPSPPATSTPAAPAPAYTADVRSAAPGSGLKVTKGAGVLPNEHGQVWREYDISPYTLKIQGAAKPEQ